MFNRCLSRYLRNTNLCQNDICIFLVIWKEITPDTWNNCHKVFMVIFEFSKHNIMDIARKKIKFF